MTHPNVTTLESLFASGAIDLARGPIFDTDPPPPPADFDFDKVEGMMLGLAIGDALGNTSEGMLPHKRRLSHGEVRDYLRHRRHGDCRGYPSDDTQLAFWTLEQLLADGGLVPENLARRLCRGEVFGIGKTVGEFRGNMRRGLPWHQAGPRSAGNGALMRIAPVLIPHLRRPSPELWADAALAAMVTHNDAGSTAACVAMVNILWRLLAGEADAAVTNGHWWLRQYVDVARELETRDDYEPRGGAWAGKYRGPLWRYAERRVTEAWGRDLPAVEACQSWYSGAYLMETLPSVLYVLMRHGHDAEEAIVRAANDTKDNDTTAAIVGAAVGALHGRAGLPARWVEGLSGRTAKDDEGRVFELLEQARRAWGPGAGSSTGAADTARP